MSNEDHIARIRAGPSEWREWRKANPKVRVDLSGLDLSDLPPWWQDDLGLVDLSGCDLQGCPFWEGSLDHAVMRRAVLTGGIFHKVSFQGADLRGVKAEGCQFTECNFDDANLSAMVGDQPLERRDRYGANVFADGTHLRVEDDTGRYTNAVFNHCSFRRSRFDGAWLSRCRFHECDLNGASLRGCFANGCNFFKCTLESVSAQRSSLAESALAGCCCDKADFTDADLSACTIYPQVLRTTSNIVVSPGVGITSIGSEIEEVHGATFRSAVLANADLQGCQIRGADFSGATLSGCRVYGIGAWDLRLDGARQHDLVVTPSGEPPVTVDDVELAQFVYLMLANSRLRGIIETLTSRVVLLLGRFTPEGLALLEGIKSKLRERGYVPVLFDWDPPRSRNLTETVGLLASLAKFAVVNLSDPRCVPQELERVIPHSPSLVVQPILVGGGEPYGMFKDFLDYNSVRHPLRAASTQEAIEAFNGGLLTEIEGAVQAIRQRRLDGTT